MRRIAALAVGCTLTASGAAYAEPYTVDRYLTQQQLGPVSIDPTKRWLLVQSYDGWETAPNFDLEYNTRLAIARLRVFDLAADGVEHPLDLPAGHGYTALGFSPHGRRLAVARSRGHDYELGVIDLRTGSTRWLGLSPRLVVWGPAVAWRSDDELLVAARPKDFPDPYFGIGFQIQERLAQQWAAGARGEPSATAIGSGRYRGLRPRAPTTGLVQVDLASGDQKTLVVGDVSDFELAPNGSAVAAIVAGEDFQPDGEPTNPATEMVRKRIAIVDLQLGKTSFPCPSCDVMTRFISWSPSSDQVMVFARQGEGSFAEGRYWRFDRQGAGRAIEAEGLTPILATTWDNSGMPVGGWLDGAPVIQARSLSGRTDFWRIQSSGPSNITAALPSSGRVVGSSAGVWAVSAAGRIWRVTSRGAKPWDIAANDIQSMAEVPDGFRGASNFVPPLEQLALTSPQTSSAASWPGPRASKPVDGARVVGQGKFGAVDILKDAHGVQTVGLHSKNGRTVLATINAGFSNVDFATPIPIRHTGADGRVLTSWLYLPTRSLSAGAKPPVVVLPYPGNATASPPPNQGAGGFALSTNAQILAGAGYAALVPALPFVPNKEPMDDLAGQILAPVDVAAREGLVDGERVAAWGHSYGGYAVVAAATQTNRLRAVIASAPTVNLIQAYGRLGPYNAVLPEAGLPIAASSGWLENGQARMGSPPWVDPQRYLRNSPSTYFDRISTPMLILQGDLDKSIDQPQALFAALYRQRKDAIFVTYRGEGHVIYSPGNVRDQYARIFTLLGETIGSPQVKPPP